MELPKKINLGSGKSFSVDCLNVDINAYWKPDITADLSGDGVLARTFESARFGNVKLPLGYFVRIDAIDVLEHVPNLTALMTNCLELLDNGGEFFIKVPYDLSYGAWQDPTHIRAFNERSWLYYTDWYWYLGWSESRFDMTNMTVDVSQLGRQLMSEGRSLENIMLQPRAVDAMNVVLRKRGLTVEEKRVVEDYLRRPG